MEPLIPDGDWCLFKADRGGTGEGKVVLAQSSAILDPDSSGRFTINRYHSVFPRGVLELWSIVRRTTEKLKRPWDLIGGILTMITVSRFCGPWVFHGEQVYFQAMTTGGAVNNP